MGGSAQEPPKPIKAAAKTSSGLRQASLRYERNGGYEWASISGLIKPEDSFSGVPFQMKQDAIFRGYLGNNLSDGNESYIYLEGDFEMGASFAKQTFEGSLRIPENGGSFSGIPKFTGQSIDVSGDITWDRIRFDGEIYWT